MTDSKFPSAQSFPSYYTRNPSIENFIRNKTNQENEVAKSTVFLADFHRANFASRFAKQLFLEIQSFDANLDADQEVGVNLVSFGQSITFHVTDVGYYDPSLIVFIGETEDRKRVQLVQHISQISFLLIALPKLVPSEPKRQIGFIQENE